MFALFRLTVTVLRTEYTLRVCSLQITLYVFALFRSTVTVSTYHESAWRFWSLQIWGISLYFSLGQSSKPTNLLSLELRNFPVFFSRSKFKAHEFALFRFEEFPCNFRSVKVRSYKNYQLIWHLTHNTDESLREVFVWLINCIVMQWLRWLLTK